jgi:hypothetical protein
VFDKEGFSFCGFSFGKFILAELRSWMLEGCILFVLTLDEEES